MWRKPMSADLLLQGRGAKQPVRAECPLFLLSNETERYIGMVFYVFRGFEGAIWKPLRVQLDSNSSMNYGI